MKIFVSIAFAALMASSTTANKTITTPYGIDTRDWCRFVTHACFTGSCIGCKTEAECCKCLTSGNCGFVEDFTCVPQNNSTLALGWKNPLAPPETSVLPDNWVCPLEEISTFTPLSNEASCKLYSGVFDPKDCSTCNGLTSCCDCFQNHSATSPYAFQCIFGFNAESNTTKACVKTSSPTNQPTKAGKKPYTRPIYNPKPYPRRTYKPATKSPYKKSPKGDRDPHRRQV